MFSADILVLFAKASVG